MARVLAVAPDLIFASRIDATLTAAGHEVRLADSISKAAESGGADVLVVDLDREPPDAAVGLGMPVLGFYSHVDVETRRRAEAAGLELVVHRSRMAREMPKLVERLLARPR